MVTIITVGNGGQASVFEHCILEGDTAGAS